MRISVQDLLTYKIQAEDGEIGHVNNLLFDDVMLRVRYVVVDTGNWLFGRKVLISPMAIRPSGGTDKVLPVKLTKEQIKDSPELGADPPLSREQEIAYHNHFNWPHYWSGNDPIMGAGTMLNAPAETVVLPVPEVDLHEEPEDKEAETRDQNLRSVREVMTYDVYRDDHSIAKVVDFVVDLEQEWWSLSHIAVELTDHATNKQVLIPMGLVKMGWQEKVVYVDLPVGDLFEAPEYQPGDVGSVDRVTEYYARKV
jgi:hypothetical protein